MKRKLESVYNIKDSREVNHDNKKRRIHNESNESNESNKSNVENVENVDMSYKLNSESNLNSKRVENLKETPYYCTSGNKIDKYDLNVINEETQIDEGNEIDDLKEIDEGNEYKIEYNGVYYDNKLNDNIIYPKNEKMDDIDLYVNDTKIKYILIKISLNKDSKGFYVINDEKIECKELRINSKMNLCEIIDKIHNVEHDKENKKYNNKYNNKHKRINGNGYKLCNIELIKNKEINGYKSKEWLNIKGSFGKRIKDMEIYKTLVDLKNNKWNGKEFNFKDYEKDVFVLGIAEHKKIDKIVNDINKKYAKSEKSS